MDAAQASGHIDQAIILPNRETAEAGRKAYSQGTLL